VERFWDEGRQAYLSAPKGTADLLVPTYALHDNAAPSGASTLTEAQVALAALTGSTATLDQAMRYLRRMRQAMLQNPFGYGHLWLAADAALDGAAELMLVGTRDEIDPLRRAADSTWAPTVALAHVEPGNVPPLLAGPAEGRTRIDGRAAAYLCRHFACGSPVTEPGALVAALAAVSGSTDEMTAGG
jgi:uncharacterized protein YyaL (SSP411 family)